MIEKLPAGRMKRSYNLDITVFFVLALLISPSITLKNNNNKNFVISLKRLDLIRKDNLIALPIIEILKFSIEGLIDIYEAVEAEKNQVEIIDHFDGIEEQLRTIQGELKNILKLIEELKVAQCYEIVEAKITRTQLEFKEYLHNPSERKLDIFFEEVKDLYTYIEKLVGGLLTETGFCPDIFAAIQNATGCGMRLKNKINAIMGLVLTGVWLNAEYEKINPKINPNNSSSLFKESIFNSTSLLLERLETEMLNCHPDESNVNNEMTDIINKYSTEGRKVVADKLLDHLEDKYETKKWIVIVHPETGAQNDVYSAFSGGFHSVSAKGMAAIAISIDRASILDSVPLKDFQFPIETVNNILQNPPSIGYSLKPKSAARDVHEYLSLYLKPLRNQFIIETLVIETPCKSSEDEVKKIVFVVSSNDTVLTQFLNNGSCIDNVVLLIPVNPILSRNSSISYNLNTKTLSSVHPDCNNQTDFDFNQTGLLRNEYGQSYLSVQGDSSQEATSIILESEWRNTTGQRWRFIDNQLRNDFGKCLTAWTEQLWSWNNLYQYDCHSDWAGQTWYRHGFQIVNGFNLCLTYEGTKNGLMYVVQKLCDTTPPFLWYNSDTSCEDAVIIPSSTKGSRPFRNEFSREYLSVYENEDYVSHKPWSNQPGQKWKFVDGQLRNDHNKCLMVGKGWYVLQVDCSSGSVKAKTWTLNEKRQLISDGGYCLTVDGDTKGYVLISYCKDDPKYRWWY